MEVRGYKLEAVVQGQDPRQLPWLGLCHPFFLPHFPVVSYQVFTHRCPESPGYQSPIVSALQGLSFLKCPRSLLFFFFSIIVFLFPFSSLPIIHTCVHNWWQSSSLCLRHRCHLGRETVTTHRTTKNMFDTVKCREGHKAEGCHRVGGSLRLFAQRYLSQDPGGSWMTEGASHGKVRARAFQRNSHYRGPMVRTSLYSKKRKTDLWSGREREQTRAWKTRIKQTNYIHC